MAIKSALRPETIVGRSPKSVESAQNFISGGVPLGSSVVSSAANKIVGFQRAAVKPVTPDINSIVSTISSNILNQVDNSVRNATNITNKQTDDKIQQVSSNITNQIQQIKQQQTNQVTQLQTVVQNIQQQTKNFVEQLTDNYKKRTEDIDSAKPIGILDKFLKAYQNAVGFIQFFGSGKNIKQLREGLQTLKTSFTESFEIAKLIRQTILKIVSQLSNLPQVSSGGSPGINLDVDVPGGPLRRTAPRNVKFGRKGAGLLGLGLGAVGGGLAVNALADSDRLQSMPQVTNIPMGIADRFAFIVEKFANAVEEMIKGSPKKDKSSPSTSAPGGGTTTPKPPSTSGGGMTGGASDVTADTQEEKAWLQTLRATEGTAGQDGYGKVFGGQVVKELAEGKLTIEEAARMSETGKLPDRLGGKQIAYGKYRGRVSGATGAYQFMPDTLRAAARRAGVDLNTPMTPEIQDKLALAHLQAIGIDPSKRATEATIRKAGGSAGWAGVHGEATGQTSRTVADSLRIYNQFYGKPQAKPDKGMGGLGVDPSMFAPEERAKLAMNISQPPPSQAKSTISMLPIGDMSGGQQPQQSTGGGGQIVVPPENEGPTVPLLSSSDPANFLTMYSKIVYNIVDG
jgi:muramidase (phage lysozyme)